MSIANRIQTNRRRACSIGVERCDRIILAIQAWYRGIHRVMVELFVSSKKRPKCLAWCFLHLSFYGRHFSYWIWCRLSAVIVNSRLATGYLMWLLGLATLVQWLTPYSTRFSTKFSGKHLKRFCYANTAKQNGDHKDNRRSVANHQPPNWTSSNAFPKYQKVSPMICYSRYSIFTK